MYTELRTSCNKACISPNSADFKDGIFEQPRCLCSLHELVGTYILSQSYNATVFNFDNIFFLEHVSNQLFIPNENSISQASYRTRSGNKPFYGGRVVEKNEMHGDVPVSVM